MFTLNIEYSLEDIGTAVNSAVPILRFSSVEMAPHVERM
jgi:hypothetical protein